jgi:hypothetical protein
MRRNTASHLWLNLSGTMRRSQISHFQVESYQRQRRDGHSPIAPPERLRPLQLSLSLSLFRPRPLCFEGVKVGR